MVKRSRTNRAVFDSVKDGRQPIGHIQRRGLSGQNVIAQCPQDHRQVSEQLFRRRINLIFAMATNHGNQAIRGGACRFKVINGLARWFWIGFSHG